MRQERWNPGVSGGDSFLGFWGKDGNDGPATGGKNWVRVGGKRKTGCLSERCGISNSEETETKSPDSWMGQMID